MSVNGRWFVGLKAIGENVYAPFDAGEQCYVVHVGTSTVADDLAVILDRKPEIVALSCFHGHSC